MYTRDTVLRLIEQYARVIAQALGLARENKLSEAEQTLEDALLTLTSLPMKKWLTTTPENLATWLQEDQQFDTERLETVGDVFMARAEVAEAANQHQMALRCYQNAHALYVAAEGVNPKILSLPLRQKIQFASAQIL